MPTLMSSFFASDVRKQWMCARVLSLRRHRASARAIERALQEYDDGDWSVSFGLYGDNFPEVTFCEKPGYVLTAIGGVPSLAVARAFVSGFGNTSAASPIEAVNPVALVIGDEIAETVQTILRRNPAQGTIVGWSMGGVVAAYIGAWLVDPARSQAFEVLTFGSPRFGTARFNDLAPSALYRVFNRLDPIPFVPVWSTESIDTWRAFRAWYFSSDTNAWRHSGIGWVLDANARRRATMPDVPADGIGLNLVGWASGLMYDPIIEHAIATYEARLFNLALPTLPDLLPIAAEVEIPQLRVPVEPPPVTPPVPANMQRIAIAERTVPDPPTMPASVRAAKPFYSARLDSSVRPKSEWWVWHWETPLFRAKDRSAARKAASRLNSLALAWNQSTAGEQQDLVDAIQIQFPDA